MRSPTVKTPLVRTLNWAIVALSVGILIASGISYYRTNQRINTGEVVGYLCVLVGLTSCLGCIRSMITGTLAGGAVTRMNQPAQFGFYVGLLAAFGLAMVGAGLFKLFI